MITSRLELMLECDYPGCGDYPNGELGQCTTRTMDQMDVKGKATTGKMKALAIKEGWSIYGNTAYCPRCHLKDLNVFTKNALIDIQIKRLSEICSRLTDKETSK